MELPNEVQREMNRIFNDLLGVRKQARYKYWEDNWGNMFFYTVKKILHKGKAKYVSGIYRYYKTKKMWKPMYKAGHGKKKKAKERAYRLYQKWKSK